MTQIFLSYNNMFMLKCQQMEYFICPFKSILLENLKVGVQYVMSSSQRNSQDVFMSLLLGWFSTQLNTDRCWHVCIYHYKI